MPNTTTYRKVITTEVHKDNKITEEQLRAFERPTPSKPAGSFTTYLEHHELPMCTLQLTTLPRNIILIRMKTTS